MAELQPTQLKLAWLAHLPTRHLRHVSPLRQDPGIEILITAANDDHSEQESMAWLRGPSLDEPIDRLLRSVLGCTLFHSLHDGQLVPVGSVIPQGHVPQGEWQPLQNAMKLSLPSKRFAHRRVQALQIVLERSARDESPDLVVLARRDWLAYATTAPSVRLNRLMFATSDAETIVLGHPLPPLSGDFYWTKDGVAAPVGFHWSPAVAATVIRKKLQLEGNDVALLQVSGEYCIIRQDQFVRATRSAVRQTEGC